MIDISLVPTGSEDLDVILAIETSPQNAPYIGQWERKQHEKAIENPNIAHLKIVLDNQIIGYVILIGITNPDRSIQLKRIVVEPKGYGFGRETIRLIKEMVFNKFQAHRFWLDVMIHNTRAYNLYLSEGFVEEGIHRESLKQGENFIELRVMSILESEYRLT
jgi:RimJ/RimL family protein N-acetyltransferase